MSGQEIDSPRAPKAILVPDYNSQGFNPRCLYLSQPVKIGRAFGKSFKPADNNAFFDCKVLSRHHAQLFYHNGKFYLQDTKSSNGTFVNSVRLSPANTESKPCQIYHMDTVQFGVEVLDNERRITINCIVAKIELFHPNGKEAIREGVPIDHYSEKSKSGLTALSGYLSSTSDRERALQHKLAAIGEVLEKVQANSEESWKSMIEEDRLLRRIEFLQDKLESILDSSMKNPDTDVVSLQKKLIRIQEEREAYEIKAKETVEKILLENLTVVSKNTQLELLLKSLEEQKNVYKNTCDDLVVEIKRLTEELIQQAREIDEIRNLRKPEELYDSIMKTDLILPKSNFERILVGGQELTNGTTTKMEDQVSFDSPAIDPAFSANKPVDNGENDSNSHDTKLAPSELSQSQIIDCLRDLLETNENSTYEETLKPSKNVEVTANVLNYISNHTEEWKSDDTLVQKENVNGSTVEERSNKIENSGLVEGSNAINAIDYNNPEKERSCIQVPESKEKPLIDEEQLTPQQPLEFRELKMRFDELSSEHHNCSLLKKEAASQFESLQKEYDRILLQNKGYGETFALFTEKESKFIEDISQLNAKYENALEEINQLKASIKEYQSNNLVNSESIISRKNTEENESSLQQELTVADSENSSDIINVEEPVPKQVSLSDSTNLPELCKSFSDDDRTCSNQSANQDDSKHIFEAVSDNLAQEPSPTEEPLVTVDLQTSKEISSTNDIAHVNSAKSSLNQSQQPAENDIIEKELDRLRNLQMDYELANDILQSELKSLEDELETLSYQNKTASVCAIVPLLILFFAIIFAYYPSLSSVTGTLDT